MQVEVTLPFKGPVGNVAIMDLVNALSNTLLAPAARGKVEKELILSAAYGIFLPVATVPAQLESLRVRLGVPWLVFRLERAVTTLGTGAPATVPFYS